MKVKIDKISRWMQENNYTTATMHDMLDGNKDGMVDTKEFVDLDTIAAAFAKAGVTPDKRVLNYCGGGIAATLDAYLLHQLGYTDLAVYDNSMNEWAKDGSLPSEKDWGYAD